MSTPGDRFYPTMLTVVFCAGFDAETVYFAQLPNIVNRFLVPSDPIVLHRVIETYR